MKKIIPLLLLLILTSCASYQAGEFAVHETGNHPNNVPIKAKVDSVYTNSPFVFVNFTFGNKNVDWVRVKSIKISQTPELSKANIVMGDDLSSWAESMKHKIAIDNHNRQVFIGSVTTALAAAAVVGASKGNVNLAYGSLGAMTAVTGIDEVSKVIAKANDAERSRMIPDDHLLAPFSIPPGLVTKRWILLQSKTGKFPSKIGFEVEYIDGKSANYSVII
ncbi:MAG: hypothetical protein KC493_06185 [Bacteriovoracaceae bacterium]|nr:hypothetical protein [Bacteriovoracaceae bacterium]